MAQPPKTTWPKTDAGTTDWEHVFETPETGFIALISQVQSTASLKLGATVVIEKLFTRKVDSAERTRLITQLDDIIAQGGTDLAAMIKGVTDLLRTIKDIRIQKAETYIKRQKAGAAIDRRTGLLWKIDLLLKPVVLFPVGGLFIVVVAGLIFLFMQSAFGPTTQETPKEASRVVEKIAPKETPSPPEVAPPVARVPVLLKAFRWPLLAQGVKDRPQYYAVVLYIEKREDSRLICRRVPKVLDTIYQSFNTVMRGNRSAQKDEMGQLQSSVKRAVNALLPKPVIGFVDVSRYGEKGYRVTTLPPYCKLFMTAPAEKTSKPKKE